MIVVLTESERRMADWVAERRNRRNIELGHTDRKGFIGDEAARLELNRIGVRGEIAAAIALDVYWAPMVEDRTTAIDFPAHRIEIKTTRFKDGHLIVQPNDPDARYVLVIEDGWGVHRIAGWLERDAARRVEWWRKDVRYPAYFVPQKSLKPIEDLKASIHSELALSRAGETE